VVEGKRKRVCLLFVVVVVIGYEVVETKGKHPL